jgi:4-aminobutyrate aminotransferase-like enzyme
VMEAAYHGNSTTLIDISPYKHNGPGGYRPPVWVHTVPIPDLFRGRYRISDPLAVSKYIYHLQEEIEKIDEQDSGLAGFIAETCPSVGGQIFLPDNYLTEVYKMVRSAGGVCIADEVQTGYGRIGTHFYAFEAHKVVPDIVVLGKPIGNGHPIGAVITTQEIAKAFDNGMEFFSTFGGNPVSCAIGITVLDVVQSEGLQAHALEVGQYLSDGFRHLQSSFPLIGDVRGSGLFLGIELVRDPITLGPATQEADFIANKMRESGILLGTDGPDHNVIKIRPPMPFNMLNAQYLLDTFQRILSAYFP